MDVYRAFLFFCINFIASIEGTVTIADPSRRNAATFQGTLTLTCTVSPLKGYVYWFTPASAGRYACFCYYLSDTCSSSIPVYRASCTSDISQGQFNLTITNMTNVNDEGIYTCKHLYSQENNTLTISVQVPISSVDVTSPTISPVTVSENSSSTFVCETSAGRPQATIQWYKQLGTNPAVPLQGGTITTIQCGPSVITRSILQYTPTRSDHEYKVFCTAYNIDVLSLYTSSNKPQIYVQYGPDNDPVIEGQPSGSSVNILDGRAHTLMCSVEGGRPLASLSWTCVGDTVRDESAGTTKKAQTAEITHDGLRCTCHASHPLWTSTRQVYVPIGALYTSSSPIFTVNSQSVTSTISVVEGNGVSVTCSSTSSPPPVYAWILRGSSSNGNILALTNVSSTSGFTCTVTNTTRPTQGDQESGSSSSLISVNVFNKPKMPTNITIGTITHNTAAIHWVHGFNGGLEQTFYIEYWPSSENDITTVQQKRDTGEETLNSTLIYLTSETDYTVQMYTESSIGTSTKSKHVTFKTKEIPNTESASSEHSTRIIAGVTGGLAAALVVFAIVIMIVRKYPTEDCLQYVLRKRDPVQEQQDETNGNHVYANTTLNTDALKQQDDSDRNTYEDLNVSSQQSYPQGYEQLQHGEDQRRETVEVYENIPLN